MTVRGSGLLLGAALLASQACSAPAQNGTRPDGSDGMSLGRQSGGSRDANFAREAAAANMAEIQAGRLALDRSTDARIKQLAHRIIADHTRAGDQLARIAQRARVTLPGGPTPAQKQELGRLESLSGPAFDRTYAQAVVEHHRIAIELFGIESASGSDAELKQFAGTMLPVLGMHLQMARQIARGSLMRHHASDRTDDAPDAPAPGASGP